MGIPTHYWLEPIFRALGKGLGKVGLVEEKTAKFQLETSPSNLLFVRNYHPVRLSLSLLNTVIYIDGATHVISSPMKMKTVHSCLKKKENNTD